MKTNILFILVNLLFTSINYSFAQVNNYSFEEMKNIYHYSSDLNIDSCDVIYRSFINYDEKDLPFFIKHQKNNFSISDAHPSKYVWLENEKYPNGILVWIGFRNSEYDKVFKKTVKNFDDKNLIENVSKTVKGIKAVWITDSLLLLRSPFFYRSTIMAETSRKIAIERGQITSISKWNFGNFGLLRDVTFLFNGETVVVDGSINWELRHKMAINLLARDVNTLKDKRKKLDNIYCSVLLYVDSNQQINAEVLDLDNNIKQSNTFKAFENIIKKLNYTLLPNYMSIDGYMFNGLFLKLKYENNRFILYDYR